MFFSLNESGNYILLRINMLLNKLFNSLDTYLIEDKKNNIIYINVILIYKNKRHICTLALKEIINKKIAEIYVYNLISKIEDKLNLH